MGLFKEAVANVRLWELSIVWESVSLMGGQATDYLLEARPLSILMIEDGLMLCP